MLLQDAIRTREASLANRSRRAARTSNTSAIQLLVFVWRAWIKIILVTLRRKSRVQGKVRVKSERHVNRILNFFQDHEWHGKQGFEVITCHVEKSSVPEEMGNSSCMDSRRLGYELAKTLSSEITSDSSTWARAQRGTRAPTGTPSLSSENLAGLRRPQALKTGMDSPANLSLSSDKHLSLIGSRVLILRLKFGSSFCATKVLNSSPATETEVRRL